MKLLIPEDGLKQNENTTENYIEVDNMEIKKSEQEKTKENRRKY